MSEHQEHVDPLGAYIKVFVALMVLLLITVGAYFLKFDEWWGPQWGFLNTTIALIIASIKTALVMLVFMHLRHATKLTWIIASAGFLWLCIMITFTFADYLSRSSMPESDPGIGRTEVVLPAGQVDRPGF
jgi:cytochrome c oxidase subunit 4